jgi:thiamine kinase-like enzyme
MSTALEAFHDIEKVISRAGFPISLCHNDFHFSVRGEEGNALIRERGKAFLIDWEEAGLGYCFYDLAKASLPMSVSEIKIFLEAYLGRVLTGRDVAYFACMRLLTILTVALNRLGRKTNEKELKREQQREQQNQLDKLMKDDSLPFYLELPLGGRDGVELGGVSALRAFIQGVKSPSFSLSMKILSKTI